MIKISFYFLTILLSLVCMIACSPADHHILGVKCYKLPASEVETIDAWESLGVNTAYVSEEIAGNPEFRRLAREADIKVYLIFPVFYNPEALQADSTLWAITAAGEKAKDGWVEFVCPSNHGYRENVIAHAKQAVSQLQPDGLSIDFIRHFAYWEMVTPSQKEGDLTDACYCRHCLQQFAEETQIRYPDTLQSTKQFSAYINEQYLSDWVDFKCELITSMVNELTSEVRNVDPGIKFNLHAVPWRKDDYHGAALRITGQDLSELAPLVDYISPMCYTHMLYRDAAWVDSIVIDFQHQGVEKVLPSIQVGESYLDKPFMKEEFCNCIQYSFKHQNNGIVFWSWEMLEKDSLKQTCVKEIEFIPL